MHFQDRRSSAGALLVALTALSACGDATGPGPEPQVVGLHLPESVHLDALQDSVRLPAQLVFDNGEHQPLDSGHWIGEGGDAATLYSDGWVWTRAEGTFTATVTYDALSATTDVVVRRAGRILLTFDDGWRSARTVALPALAAAGLVGNVAVVVQTIGWPAYLDRGEMQDLHDAGWAFVSHSLSHDDLTALSDAELETDLADSRAWVRDQGLRMGDAFIVPFHAWGERERSAIRRHYAAARGATVDATWPTFVAAWRPEDPYGITALDASAMLRADDGPANIMEWVHDAIDQAHLLDLMFHDVRPEDVDAFLVLVDQLAEVRQRVFTWADIYPPPTGQ